MKGDTAGESVAFMEDVLLDQVLKCAGGGREPTGRVGRLLRRSCRKPSVVAHVLVWRPGMLRSRVVEFRILIWSLSMYTGPGDTARPRSLAWLIGMLLVEAMLGLGIGLQRRGARE